MSETTCRHCEADHPGRECDIGDLKGLVGQLRGEVKALTIERNSLWLLLDEVELAAEICSRERADHFAQVTRVSQRRHEILAYTGEVLVRPEDAPEEVDDV